MSLTSVADHVRAFDLCLVDVVVRELLGQRRGAILGDFHLSMLVGASFILYAMAAVVPSVGREIVMHQYEIPVARTQRETLLHMQKCLSRLNTLLLVKKCLFTLFSIAAIGLGHHIMIADLDIAAEVQPRPYILYGHVLAFIVGIFHAQLTKTPFTRDAKHVHILKNRAFSYLMGVFLLERFPLEADASLGPLQAFLILRRYAVGLAYADTLWALYAVLRILPENHYADQEEEGKERAKSDRSDEDSDE